MRVTLLLLALFGTACTTSVQGATAPTTSTRCAELSRQLEAVMGSATGDIGSAVVKATAVTAAQTRYDAECRR